MVDNRTHDILDILNQVIFPCCFRRGYLYSGRPALEGVHAYLCAKEIDEMLKNKALFLDLGKRQSFNKHKDGVEIVKSWARSSNLIFEEEIDISVGVADVLVYADDVGIFEIGNTQPAKILLLLKYIVRLSRPYTVHFWPYVAEDAFVFRNWRRRPQSSQKALVTL